MITNTEQKANILSTSRSYKLINSPLSADSHFTLLRYFDTIRLQINKNVGANVDKRFKKFVIFVLAMLLTFFALFLVSKTKESNRTEKAEEWRPNIKEIILEPPTQKEIVCLDPGHGGKDVGAEYGSIDESEINLFVAKEVATDLVKSGYKVYLTRDDDTFIYKRDRARYCNSVNADILVAIHHNSYKTDRNVDYTTVLYYKETDKKLGSSLLEKIASNLEIRNQGISKFDNSELWIAKMPAVMTEAFFITNTAEYKLLQKDNSRLIVEAEAITEGIINFFTNPTQITDSASSDTLIIDRADLED